MMIDCDREKWPNFTGTWETGKDIVNSMKSDDYTDLVYSIGL